MNVPQRDYSNCPLPPSAGYRHSGLQNLGGILQRGLRQLLHQVCAETLPKMPLKHPALTFSSWSTNCWSFNRLANYLNACILACRHIEKHVQSVKNKQNTAVCKSDWVSLQAMAVMTTLFKWTAMDIVKPLQKTSAGYQYILVVFDYVIRFPESFSQWSVKTSKLICAPVQLFTRAGIPDCIGSWA